VAAEIGESRALFDLVKAQGRDGALGIVQGERALMHLEHHRESGGEHARTPYDDPDSAPRPYLPSEKEGAEVSQ
jgi:hypothetical protein